MSSRIRRQDRINHSGQLLFIRTFGKTNQGRLRLIHRQIVRRKGQDFERGSRQVSLPWIKQDGKKVH